MSKGFSLKKRTAVFEKFSKKCAYCGIKITYKEMHVDHIVPKFRGYTNFELKKYGREKGSCKIENLNPSCASCNLSKSTFTIEQWRDQLILKHERLIRDNSNYRILNRFGAIKFNKNISFYFEKFK